MIKRLIDREGGYSNVPGDHGGCTKYGITLETLQQDRGRPDLSCQDLSQLSMTEAADIYQRRYLDAPGFSHVANLPLRELLFDSAVQHDPERPVMWLQAALGVTVDGDIGPKTLGVLGTADVLTVFAEVYRRRLGFYAQIVTHHASQLKFLEGWLNRMGNVLDACLHDDN